MIELANGLDRLLQLPIIVQPAANLGDPLPTYAQLTRTPTRISHRQHKHPMTFAARTLRTTTPMTDNALKQRAAHKLAADWKPIHEFLPRLKGSVANHPRAGGRFGSDDAPFSQKGIPTIGLYTGAGGPKSEI